MLSYYEVKELTSTANHSSHSHTPFPHHMQQKARETIGFSIAKDTLISAD